MRTRTLIGLAIALSVAGFAGAAFAATADDYKAAAAKAETAIKEAHAHKNEWTTTGAAMKAAKAAAAAGKFDDAVKHAQEAETGRRARRTPLSRRAVRAAPDERRGDRRR